MVSSHLKVLPVPGRMAIFTPFSMATWHRLQHRWVTRASSRMCGIPLNSMRAATKPASRMARSSAINSIRGISLSLISIRTELEKSSRLKAREFVGEFVGEDHDKQSANQINVRDFCPAEVDEHQFCHHQEHEQAPEAGEHADH